MRPVRMIQLLRRALTRNPSEIATRLTQHVHTVAERAAGVLPLSNGRGAADVPRTWNGPPRGELATHFRTRSRPRFFAGLDERASAVAELRARWPEAEAATVAAADRILAGRFDLLGYRGLYFGSPPDWHLDPIRGVRAPNDSHWSRIAYLDPAVAGDHKVVWELNRHQYLVTLGQAWWYTGDTRYAAAFVEHLTAWMDANPPHRGVNWASSLEVGFRAISWLWALHFFRNAECVTEAFLARVLRVLRLHARHIERYLSTYFSPNTHLTGEALGLFYLGTLLPEFREAARWQRTALDIFAREIPRQVLPDGVYFEQSTWYHRYTADFLFHLLVLADSNGIDAGVAHRDVLARMLDHVMGLTRADGTVPLIGDDDGGCLMPLAGPPTDDFRALLSTGAALFGRSDWKAVAGGACRDTFWLLGVEGLRRYDALTPSRPAFDSRAWPDGGFYVMRDGWGSDANCLVVDAGPHGSLAGGHAHADALAVAVSCGEGHVLVDAGTGTYTSDRETRDLFRSSQAHNTLSVDDHSSSVPAGPFRWHATAETTVDHWITHPRFDFFRGTHDGFTRLSSDLRHRRDILFLRGDYWVLRDAVRAAHGRSVESRLHFGPDVQVAAVDTDDGVGVDTRVAALAATLPATGRRVLIHVVGASAGVRLEPCRVSDAYGSFREAVRAVARVPGSDTTELLTLVLPGMDAATPIRRLDSERGTFLTLANGEFIDWILTGAVQAPDVRTDFDWAWLRRCARSGRIVDYVLLDGSSLFVDGEAIVQGPRTGHLCMTEGGVVEDPLAQD